MRKAAASLPSSSIAMALSLIATFAVGMIAYHFAFSDANADAHGSGGEVRVATRSLDDGRVEVAVQQRAGSADWGARQLPDARFLPADVEPGVWRVSSSVAALSAPEPEATASEPASDADESANPAERAFSIAAEESTLYCLVTHERTGDSYFWNLIRQGAARFQQVTPVDIRVLNSPDVQEQANLVRQCVADGAVGVGVTLADPDGMQAAISEATAAGVVVVSFNSGLQDWKRVGSTQHISVDEVAGGVEIARHLIEAGVSGTVLCVIHEERNIGLEERCDGLEQGYTEGAVERMALGATGVEDLAATEALIVERLTDEAMPAVGGVVTLNSRLSLAALAAVKSVGSDAKLGTFDQEPAVLQAIVDGDILVSIDTVPWYQAWYAMSSLMNKRLGKEVLVEFYGLSVEQSRHVSAEFAVTLEPVTFTSENAATWIEVSELINQIRSPEASE